MRFILFVLPMLVISVAAHNAAQQSTDTIVQRLRSNPGAPGLISVLSKRSDDPKVIPALRDLFAQAKLSGDRDLLGYPVSRDIASALIVLGVKDDVYFEEVAKYAREAIDLDPPLPYKQDAEGNDVIQERNPTFEQWCAIRDLEFNVCTRQMADLVMSMNFLAGAHDPRAIPILRKGLNMSNDMFVVTAALGLAKLNDTESIPLIAETCRRLPVRQAETIAFSAVDFDHPAVLALFDNFIQDSRKRESVKTEWQDKHKKAGVPIAQ